MNVSDFYVNVSTIIYINYYVFYRLTKYPLLFENLAKYTTSGTEEAMKVQRAWERSKEILNYVNAAVKEAEDQHRLAEIQRRLDKGPFDKVVDHPMANEFKVSVHSTFQQIMKKYIFRIPEIWC